MPRREYVIMELDGLTKLRKAKVYQELPGFICFLADDVQESIVGRGESVEEAVENWDLKLQSHLTAGDNDPIVKYVKSLLGRTPSSGDLPSVIKGPLKAALEKTREHNIAEFQSQYSSKRRSKINLELDKTIRWCKRYHTVIDK